MPISRFAFINVVLAVFAANAAPLHALGWEVGDDGVPGFRFNWTTSAFGFRCEGAGYILPGGSWPTHSDGFTLRNGASSLRLRYIGASGSLLARPGFGDKFVIGTFERIVEGGPFQVPRTVGPFGAFMDFWLNFSVVAPFARTGTRYVGYRNTSPDSLLGDAGNRWTGIRIGLPPGPPNNFPASLVIDEFSGLEMPVTAGTTVVTARATVIPEPETTCLQSA